MGIRLINARSLAYTGTSAKFTLGFEAGKRYALTSDTDCWYEWDVEGAAVVAAEDGAIQLLAGQIREDSPKNGAYLHVIRSAVSGTLNVAEIEEDAAPTVNVEVVNDEPIRVRETKAY
jgi:hypothetical protein